jgi:hypothetical protein
MVLTKGGIRIDLMAEPANAPNSIIRNFESGSNEIELNDVVYPKQRRPISAIDPGIQIDSRDPAAGMNSVTAADLIHNSSGTVRHR